MIFNQHLKTMPEVADFRTPDNQKKTGKKSAISQLSSEASCFRLPETSLLLSLV